MLNEYYKNIGFKGFIQRYGLLNAVRRGIYMAYPVHYVRDYEIKKVLWQGKASNKVKKYLKFRNTDVEGLKFSDKELSEPVWIYWNKGLENAPVIVKKCYESIQKYSNRDVILLTDENLLEYIQLPDYIEKKKNDGLIPMAGYADLMRFALLEHYGGTWIDSTVYLTGNIPDSIMNCDFFAFRNTMMLIDNPVLYPAWFLHAKKGNKTIREIRNSAFAYWKDNKHVIEYLLPNLIITQVLKSDSSVEEKIPYMSSDYSEYLIKVLGDKFDEEKWKWITELTQIHKLTYKLDEKIDYEDSFYHWIVNKKIK